MAQSPPLQLPAFESFSGKLHDKTPLLRRDIQYDLLCHLFNDKHEVFTDPWDTLSGKPKHSKVTFRDLYVNGLIHASKASKVLKDKIRDEPPFGTDFAMISLLANVGRVGNSMAFFTEMKTTLRFYHPVPALTQHGNIQDVPRIRLILKSVELGGEGKGCPSTPSEILAQLGTSEGPPTTAANFFFVLASHADSISDTHAPGYSFLSLFMPCPYSSASRARVILWLLHHYLEGPPSAEDIEAKRVVNPFCDPEYSLTAPPHLVPLTPEEYTLENVDTEAELESKDKLIQQRDAFIAMHVDKDKDPSASATKRGSEDATRPKRVRKRPAGPPSPQPQQPSQPPSKVSRSNVATSAHDSQRRISGHHSSTQPFARPGLNNPYIEVSAKDTIEQDRHVTRQRESRVPVPIPRPVRQDSPQPSVPPHPEQTNGSPRLAHQNEHRHSRSPLPPLRQKRRYDFEPAIEMEDRPRRKSMLHHAWDVVNNLDPLQDSDQEQDEFLREDTITRIAIVSRLRGKPPTPEPKDPPHVTS